MSKEAVLYYVKIQHCHGRFRVQIFYVTVDMTVSQDLCFIKIAIINNDLG